MGYGERGCGEFVGSDEWYDSADVAVGGYRRGALVGAPRGDFVEVSRDVSPVDTQCSIFISFCELRKV